MLPPYTDQEKAAFRAELDESIDDIEKDLAAAQAALNLAIDQRDEWRTKTCYDKIDWAEERLRRAQQRSQCSAGKWCKGVGGVGKVALRSLEGYGADAILCRVYCECDAASQRQQADTTARVEYRRQEYELRVGKWVDDLPAAFTAFRKHELDTLFVETDAQRRVIAQIREWLDGEGSMDKPWLALCGPVGTGKTSIAVAVGKALIRHGCKDVVIVDVSSFLSRIRRTYSKGADERESDVLEELQEAEVLILDDLGVERVTDWVQEMLFSLINHRYGDTDGDGEFKFTIITSNYDLAGLAEHVGGVAGERLAWRIGERAEVISLEDCPNLRAPRSSSQSPQAEPRNVSKIKRGAA
jgi:DNA replication protein DnaC